jgi:hypothetical protein
MVDIYIDNIHVSSTMLGRLFALWFHYTSSSFTDKNIETQCGLVIS